MASQEQGCGRKEKTTWYFSFLLLHGAPHCPYIASPGPLQEQQTGACPTWEVAIPSVPTSELAGPGWVAGLRDGWKY